jgi:hypothetical protein
MFRLRRPPAGPHFPRLKLQHHETMLAQISASNLQFLLTRTPVMQSIDLRGTGSRLAPYLSCARYHAQAQRLRMRYPHVTVNVTDRTCKIDRVYAAVTLVTVPYPCGPLPQTFGYPITPIKPDQTASKPIKLHQTELPTLPNSDT